jgi:hypothetical protein
MNTPGKLGLWLGLMALALGIALLVPAKVSADGLHIRPLLFRETLQAGQKKKGYVDVSNPSHVPVTASMTIKSFRQTDSRGSLRFDDNKELAEGIQLDLSEVAFGPREAVRIYFQIDSAKLPPGDVFAAIFAGTSTQSANAGPAAQVGTLLILENGQSGPRSAETTGLSAALVIMSNDIKGTVTVRNTAPGDRATGFFPKLRVSVGPFDPKVIQFEGPLVFAGNSREVPFTLRANNRLGIYRLTADTNGSVQHRWVFMVTGFWRVAMPVLLLAIGGLVLARRRRVKRLVLPDTAVLHPPESASDPADGLSARAAPKPAKKPKPVGRSPVRAPALLKKPKAITTVRVQKKPLDKTSLKRADIKPKAR